MTFATYWMQVQLPISRKLKNGLHLIEAEEWRKGWWKVKAFGALRSSFVSPRIWDGNAKIPYTGQPFGLAMQELHKLPEKGLPYGKAPEPIPGPDGPVCLIRSPTAGEGSLPAPELEGISPDRVRRQRRVRSARRAAPRKSYPKRRT